MIDIKNNGDSNITKPLSFSQNQSYKNNIDDEELKKLNLDVEFHAQLTVSGNAKASTLESAKEALDKYRKNKLSE